MLLTVDDKGSRHSFSRLEYKYILPETELIYVVPKSTDLAVGYKVPILTAEKS